MPANTVIRWPTGESLLNRLVVRATYLMVAGIMLAYLTAFCERSRDRLAKLAAWPGEEAIVDEAPSLCRSLAHAADVSNAKRVLVVWEENDEPSLHYSVWGADDCTSGTCSLVTGGVVTPELEGTAFMARDPLGRRVELRAGHRVTADPPLAAELVRNFEIGAFATAPFEGNRFRGRVFILEPRYLGEGLLLLTEIVSLRIGVQLEHFGLRRDLTEAARTQERVRLVHDIHDGILQDLTAADLQLKGMIREAPAGIGSELAEISALIETQQSRIRSFVDAASVKPQVVEPLQFQEQISQFAEELGRQWRCAVEVKLDPLDLQPPGDVGYQICLMLSEAAANAVRHGAASQVLMAIRRDAGVLAIELTDNGGAIRALAAGNGQTLSPETLVSNSLRQRVRDLGGSLSLSDSPDGLRIFIVLPITHDQPRTQDGRNR